MGLVMIVEDNADLRHLYQLAVRNEGFKSLAAGDGQDALQILRTTEDLPRLIILDLMMPIMDGWQFLEEKEKDPAIKSIPVVVCSASRDSIPTGLQFIRKPVDLSKLVELLHQYCQ